MDRSQTLDLLRVAVGNEIADFRPGQWEAIEALVDRRERLLMVQRTGWGKSNVYFLAIRLLREQGRGPTLIVSPLLALMRNQIEAAERIGVKAASINSTNPGQWPEIRGLLQRNEADALLIAKLLGRCQKCSRPAIPGQSRCPTCAEAHRQSRRRSDAMRRDAAKGELAKAPGSYADQASQPSGNGA